MFLGLIGILISLWALAVEIVIGFSAFTIDGRIVGIVAPIVTVLFFVSVIGTLIRLKWAIKLNIILALPFIILMLYTQFTPRMLLTEYNALSLFGKIATRMPALLFGVLIFTLCYYLPLIIISKKLISDQRKKMGDGPQSATPSK
ncbi:MAG: hypothetical protein PHX20_02445 [Candidatus Omnitrophica bacterium]|nr:hypothetical protein [Candidatus Omnitrophota bacterium]